MLTCRPGQMRAYLRAEFLIKVEFLTRPGAAAALPSSLAAGRPGLRLFAPPPRPAVAAPARQRRAGSWGRRAATTLPHPCAAARPPCRRWRQGPRQQPRPCKKLQRSRASNGKIQLRGKREFRDLAASVAKVQWHRFPPRRENLGAPLRVSHKFYFCDTGGG